MADGKKEWLVMIYLSGDNDLSEEAVWSLLEVLRAGTNEKVGVVVQIDPRFKGIRRFDVSSLLREAAKESKSKGGPHVEEVRSKVLSRGMPVGSSDDMASIRTLKEFITQSINGPNKADKHLLVLSGHAGGPIGSSFLVDQFPGSALSLKQVRAAITETGLKLDIIGMDSCGMGMAEVGHQLSDCADFLVASEGFELNTGWPYFSIIDALNRTPDMDAKTLAARIVKIHTDYYSNYLMAGVSTDMAACDLHKTTELADAIKGLALELTRNLLLRQKSSHRAERPRDERLFVEELPLANRSVADAIILAHWRAQSYRFERHTDLYDFCDLLEDGCLDEEVRDACAHVKSIIKGTRNDDDGTYDGYVIKSCHSGGSFQHSHGVAVYFPWAVVDEDYNKLSLAEKTGWGCFLQDYVVRTRRRARYESGAVALAAQMDDTETALRDFPELNTKDFPELGTKDFPELNTKDFPELGTKDFPELGTRDFPELGTRGKVLVPRMKNPPDIFFNDPC